MILNYSGKREKRKLIYSLEQKNNQDKRLFIRNKAEAILQKNMVQGFKTSNQANIGQRRVGTEDQSPKGSVLFSYSAKKRECRILSC